MTRSDHHASAQGAKPLDLPSSDPPKVRRLAILGNVMVGKTTLAGRLCAQGQHAVNIPGSRLQAQRSVLTIGPGAASRAMRKQCAVCAARSKGKGANDHCVPCVVGTEQQCPGLGDQDALRGVPATQLYDTPGSSTLAANSEDEMAARDLILSGFCDGILLVADANNLRRSLALALEVAEFGLPMVFCVNMLDEAESAGIELDDAELARHLGVPIARTVAVENHGVRKLAELLLDPQRPKQHARFPRVVEDALAKLEPVLQNPVHRARALGLLLLAGDTGAAEWVAKHLGKQQLAQAQEIVGEAQGAFSAPLRNVLVDAYYEDAGRIAQRVVVSSARSPNLLVRFGTLAQRPFSGLLIGLGVLILAYHWVGVFGATFIVDNLSARLFEGVLIPFFSNLTAAIPSAFVRDAIMDPDFGLLPTGLFLAIGIVLPVLFCFYSLQAVLEDSGYLPRLAVLFDRLFRHIGLNGQGLIPLVLGFSCIAMAVITTRMLPTRKERNILTLLVVGIPCAPLFAVMVVILGKMPWTAGFLIFGLVLVRIVVAGFVASKVIPGRLPDLIMEIPRMRVPRLRILWAKTWRRTWDFMREAVPIFLIASFVVFLFDRAGGLAVIEKAARPIVNGLLGLPDQAVQVFIKTAIRRESGATELEHLRGQFTNLQLVVTLLVMTFVMPCINATIVIIKERGLKPCLAIMATVVVSALTIGALTNLICRALGITFT